jgi:hypothetical protein
MRALEQRYFLHSLSPDQAEKRFKQYQDRIKSVKKCVDSDAPSSLEIQRQRSPHKRGYSEKGMFSLLLSGFLSSVI